MCKKTHFRGPFDKQHGKRVQALLKSQSHHFYHIHRSLADQVSWKISLLLICQILGLLVEALAADKKYRILNRDNLTIPIQMQLSEKEKTFSELFTAVLQPRLNFKYFETKDDPHRFCFSEITDSENLVTSTTKTSRFREPF